MNKQKTISLNHISDLTHEKITCLSEIQVVHDQESVQESNSSLVKQNKSIRKTDKQSKKAGRPKNSDAQKQYTKQSNRFSVAIWHFSRIMLFTYFYGDKNETTSWTLPLNYEQTEQFNKALQFMETDNFPSFQQWKQNFILHPNSLHSFLQNLRKSGQRQLNSQQMKMYLFACLYRRNLLSLTLYKYISNYWPEIVKLVKRSLAVKVEMQSKNQERYVQQQQQTNDSKDELEKELKEDQSIIAYEIACYIKACCQVSHIRLRN